MCNTALIPSETPSPWRKAKQLRFILVDQIGHAEIYSTIPENIVLSAFKQVIKE